jgi:hypothetical protein
MPLLARLALSTAALDIFHVKRPIFTALNLYDGGRKLVVFPLSLLQETESSTYDFRWFLVCAQGNLRVNKLLL